MLIATRNRMRRSAGISALVLRHRTLDLDRAADGIDDAVELDQQAVAHRAHDAAPVLADLRVDEIAADRV